MTVFRSIFTSFLILTFSVSLFAQAKGGLSGQVIDSFNAAIVGANVIVIAPNGIERVTTSNGRGEFTIGDLPAGQYTVRVTALNFAAFELQNIPVMPGKVTPLTASMTVQAALGTGSPERNLPLS